MTHECFGEELIAFSTKLYGKIVRHVESSEGVVTIAFTDGARWKIVAGQCQATGALIHEINYGERVGHGAVAEVAS